MIIRIKSLASSDRIYLTCTFCGVRTIGMSRADMQEKFAVYRKTLCGCTAEGEAAQRENAEVDHASANKG